MGGAFRTTDMNQLSLQIVHIVYLVVAEQFLGPQALAIIGGPKIICMTQEPSSSSSAETS